MNTQFFGSDKLVDLPYNILKNKVSIYESVLSLYKFYDRKQIEKLTGKVLYEIYMIFTRSIYSVSRYKCMSEHRYRQIIGFSCLEKRTNQYMDDGPAQPRVPENSILCDITNRSFSLKQQHSDFLCCASRNSMFFHKPF